VLDRPEVSVLKFNLAIFIWVLFQRGKRETRLGKGCNLSSWFSGLRELIAAAASKILIFQDITPGACRKQSKAKQSKAKQSKARQGKAKLEKDTCIENRASNSMLSSLLKGFGLLGIRYFLNFDRASLAHSGGN